MPASSTFSRRSAPISDALPTGWKRNSNSSVPATAAGFTSAASISKARLLVPWRAIVWSWPTTARSSWTRPASTGRRRGNGRIPSRSSSRDQRLAREAHGRSPQEIALRTPPGEPGLELHLPARPARQYPEPLPGGAHERLSPSPSGESAKVRPAPQVHLVRGGHHVFPFSGRNGHRTPADVLLPPHLGVRVLRHSGPPLTGPPGHHARNPSVGRPRHGYRRLAAHAPGLHDRLL